MGLLTGSLLYLFFEGLAEENRTECHFLKLTDTCDIFRKIGCVLRGFPGKQ
jgi:hypothetical protein